MALPTPAWLAEIPEADQLAARRRFLLRVAALYATERGTVSALSRRLGLSGSSLSTFVMPTTSKKISPRTAVGIETLTHGLVKAAELNASLDF